MAAATPLSLVALIADTVGRIGAFGRLLIQLAGAEFGQSMTAILRGIVAGVIAIAVFLLSLVFLLIGLVEFLLTKGIERDIAFAGVGGGLLLLCVILLLIARGQLKAASPIPHRAISHLERTLRAAREATPHE